MTEKFARLEDTEHGQCLATIGTDDETGGAAIAIRIADRHGVEPVMTVSRFPDTDAGWKAAQSAFENFDLQKASKMLADEVDKLFPNPAA